MIESYTLLAIGITLITLEAVIASFVVIWFGFGFVLVAFISFFYIYCSSYFFNVNLFSSPHISAIDYIYLSNYLTL